MQHFVGGAAWSPDGTKFAYAANARKPDRHGDLDSRRSRPARRARCSARRCSRSRPAGRPTGRSCWRTRVPEQQRRVDPPGRPRDRRVARADAARGRGAVLRRSLGAGRLRLLHASPTQAASSAGLRSTTSHRPVRVGRGADAGRRGRRRRPTTGACSPGSSTRTATTGSGCAISRPGSDLPGARAARRVRGRT